MSASSEWFGGGNAYDRCLQLEQERDALVAENQRLRDALERITRWDYSEGADNNSVRIARAALAATPSEDT
jgi:hypothetical protein